MRFTALQPGCFFQHVFVFFFNFFKVGSALDFPHLPHRAENGHQQPPSDDADDAGEKKQYQCGDVVGLTENEIDLDLRCTIFPDEQQEIERCQSNGDEPGPKREFLPGGFQLPSLLAMILR